MNNKKTHILIAGSLLCVMFLIIFFGLFERIFYESRIKNVYLSANSDDILSTGTDETKVLLKMKENGVNFVTVFPKTVSELIKENKAQTISYSSVKINEDDISSQILSAFSSENPKDDDVVVLSYDDNTAVFLKNNLFYRYDVVERQLENKAYAFLLHDIKKSDDFIVGYDSDEIKKINDSGLKLALSYPSYTFENESYPDSFCSFLMTNEVKFLIFRKNKGENKVPLSTEFINKLKKSDTALVVFENENQKKNEEGFIYKDFSSAFLQRTIRGFNTDKTVEHDSTKYRYRYYQWYNSILERNTAFINVNILKNKNETIDSNIKLTLKALKDFTEKMKKLGYSFPDSRIDVPYRHNLKTASLCGGIIIVLLLYIYMVLIDFKIRYLEMIATAFAVVSMLLSYTFYDKITAVYAVLIMIMTVSLLTLILFKIMNSKLHHKTALCLISAFMFVFFGCTVITAMLSDFDFFIGNEWFFGVSVSLLVPLVITLYNYNSVYLNIKSPKQFCEKIKKFSTGIPKTVLFITGGAFLLVIAYYIIRMGNSNLVLPAEDTLRKKLTDIFTVRPRLKEFLIGYPFFFLFIYTSVYRKNKNVNFVFAFFQTILFTSILNTCCHAFTTVKISFIRILNGLCVGIIISALIILISELVIFLKKRKYAEAVPNEKCSELQRKLPQDKKPQQTKQNSKTGKKKNKKKKAKAK